MPLTSDDAATIKEIVESSIKENNKYLISRFSATMEERLQKTKREIIREIATTLNRTVLDVQDRHEARLDDHEERIAGLENVVTSTG